MNRDIKFRMWDSLLNQFHTDGYSIDMDGYQWHDDNGYSHHFDDRFILMQYTGREDKNGKEIYEGDVVSFIDLMESDSAGIVQFRNGCFILCTKLDSKNESGSGIRMWNDGSHDWYSMENLESFELEITGNIFEI